MTAVVTASSGPPVPVPTSADPAGPSSDLLPPPTGGVAFEGDLSALFALFSQQRTTGLSLSQDGVQENKTLQATALANELAAIQREAANQSNSGRGFFGSIGKLVTDVVGDLAHGNVGDALSDANRDLGAAWNSPHFWSDLQNGLDEISVVGAAVSQAAQDIGGPVGTAVAAVAISVDQGAELGADLAGAREETFAATAKNAEADSLVSKTDLGRFQTQVEALIDNAKSSDQSLGSALDDIAGALSTNDQTLVTSAAVKG
jgi:hypothetical protein